MCQPAPICTLNLVWSTSRDPLASLNLFIWSYKFWTIRLVMEVANPLLESFGEPPKYCVTNSSHPLVNLKEKGYPDLQSVCSNYWPSNVALSLCFNHLVLLTFWQCRYTIPRRSAKPIASIHYIGMPVYLFQLFCFRTQSIINQNNWFK